MVLSGLTCPKQESVAAVADATVMRESQKENYE
jgi:hypothetical protein